MDNPNDLYNSDEFRDDAEETRKANSTKWLKSSDVSLAHLQHVKPVSVYNFGLSNKKDLKATNLSAQRSNSFTNLVAEPVLQSVGSQKTAWGSNGSIPDLLKQNSKASQRPGSAITSARKNHPPTGRKQRPQSAKEEVISKPGISVKGAKFDPSGRPPKSFSATTGWIGPPAGMKFADTGSARSEKSPPPAPTGTPTLHVDVDLQSNTTEDDNTSPRLRYTHWEPTRTPTPPHVPPAPIHLMLPSMYDNAEEDEDELDTDRLLQMAEEHIHADKKAESVSNFVSKVSSTNHCFNDLPGYTYTHVNGKTSQESKLEIHTDGDSEVVSWEKEDVNESLDFSVSEFSGSVNNTPRNELEENHQHHPLEKVSVKFIEERNVTIDITPRNTGHKVAELAKKKAPERIDEESELQSYLSVSSVNKKENPPSTRKKTVSLKEMKHENKSVRTVPNNKSFTRSEKPSNENLDFKFTSQDNVRCERSLGNRPKSAVSNRPTTPLTSVTVAYCDLDHVKKQKRNLGIKSDKELVTLVQQIQVSDSDEENDEVITPDKLQPWMPTKTTSQPSKNYYELSRQAIKSNSKDQLKEKLESQLVSGAPLVKTIKTIELDESGNELKEIKTQSFIDKQINTYGERDKQQREATRVRTKHRPASEMINRNHVKNEEETSSKEEPDQKVGSLKKKGRPFSAPLKRPSSALKDKKHNVTDSTSGEPVTDSVANDYNQNETFIVGKKTALVESVVMETEEDQMSDLSNDQYSGSESEKDLKTDKDIEIEKIIEKHLGKPSQTLTFTGTSSEDIDSPQSHCSSKSDKKQSKLSSSSEKSHSEKRSTVQKSYTSLEKSSSEKKSTVHSHSQCNCPTQSKSDTSKVNTVMMPLPTEDKVDKLNKVYGAFVRRKSAPVQRQASKAKPAERPRVAKPVYITSKKPDDFETEENLECQQLQARLAANGVNIKAETLERALYPPSGRTKYYEINAQLPQSSSSNLLSHPKEWLPIEYRQLRLAEKALNRANEIMYKQRMAEDRKARLTELAKKKAKGKKKGKSKGKKNDGTKMTIIET